MSILGIDPGGTTGVALIDIDAAGVHVLECAQLAQEEAFLWLRREIFSIAGPGLIGIERFIITPRTAKLSQQGAALEMIGAVKANLTYLLMDRGIEIPLSLQTPADAKSVWSNARLDKYKLSAPGHAKDALRHALLAAERAHLFEPG